MSISARRCVPHRSCSRCRRVQKASCIGQNFLQCKNESKRRRPRGSFRARYSSASNAVTSRVAIPATKTPDATPGRHNVTTRVTPLVAADEKRLILSVLLLETRFCRIRRIPSSLVELTRISCILCVTSTLTSVTAFVQRMKRAMFPPQNARKGLRRKAPAPSARPRVNESAE